MIPLAFHVSTADVRDVVVEDGVVWAATAGGLEGWDLDDGRRLMHDPSLGKLRRVGFWNGALTVGTDERGAWSWTGHAFEAVEFGRRVVGVTDTDLVSLDGTRLAGPALSGVISDAVLWRGHLVAGSWDHRLFVGDQIVPLPGPVLDLAVGEGGVRIAMGAGAAIWDGDLHLVEIHATAASAEAWGTAGGAVVTDQGVALHVPDAVTALAEVEQGWVVGTPNGLYLAQDGLHRLTPHNQICGNFVTATAEWKGQIVAGTFDRGACLLTDQGWRPLKGLPSPLVNDLEVAGEVLWVATGEGLVRLEGDEVEVLPAVGDERIYRRGVRGTNHRGVTGVAMGAQLWVSDLAGPTSFNGSRWHRQRYHVYGRSYQDVAACGTMAWVASEDAGVSWTDGGRWRHADASTGLPDDWVMAVACHEKQGFAGTYQDGVWRWDGTWRRLEGIADDWILSLFHDGSRLFAGTMNGLHVWDGTWSTLGGLPDPRVHSVQWHDDALWVGTEGGLTVLGRN